MPPKPFKLDQPPSFDEALRKLVSVPPAELKRREQAERDARAERKAAREKLMARRAAGRILRAKEAPSTSS